MSCVALGVVFLFLILDKVFFLRLIFSFLDKHYLKERLTFKT